MEETLITRAIVESFAKDFSDYLELDVAIVGAGPAGVTAARYLAKEGRKVAVFERNLYVGGGIWGGGMLFPRIVVQEKAKHILEEVGVRLLEHSDGCYIADSVETVSKCTAAAIDEGARIWTGMVVEDVVIRDGDRIAGLVINWGAVEAAGFHVDPLAIWAKVVIDATGHDIEVVRTVLRKIPGAKIPTPTGEVMGERPMWSEVGEREVVENTVEIYPGLIVAGMAASAAFASPRMGPIFGGMFLSGKRAAEAAASILERK